MSEAEEKLAAFWSEDGLAAYDPVFSLAVMERLARRRLYAGLASLAGVCVVSGLILWACLPPLLAWITPRVTLAPGALAPIGVALVVAFSLLGAIALLPGAGSPRMTKV